MRIDSFHLIGHSSQHIKRFIFSGINVLNAHIYRNEIYFCYRCVYLRNVLITQNIYNLSHLISFLSSEKDTFYVTIIFNAKPNRAASRIQKSIEIIFQISLYCFNRFFSFLNCFKFYLFIFF